MSEMQLPDRPALGSGFQKAVKVIVVPTGANNGARVVINTSQLPPTAEILIFNGTNQLIDHLDTGGVKVATDDQLGSTGYVALKVNTVDSANPAVVIEPADSASGAWRPSLISTVFQPNGGGGQEAQVTQWYSSYATPDRTTADRGLIQLQSRSRDGVTRGAEINCRCDAYTIENVPGTLQAVTVKPLASGGTPMLHLQTTNAITGNRAMDMSHAGDSFSSWRMDFDGTQSWGPGGASDVDTKLLRFAAHVLGTDSDFAVTTAGKGYRVKEGANAKMGTATLAAGTVVVNTTAVTANSRIFLTAQNTGAGPGALRVSATVVGTSFTVTSTNAADTSTFAWLIMEPS